MSSAAPLWRPSPARIERARITDYRRWLAEHHGLQFADYEALWQWSVDELETFWATLWDYFQVRGHAPWRQVLERRVMPGAKWFEGATLNYAEHCLAAAEKPDASTRLAVSP